MFLPLSIGAGRLVVTRHTPALVPTTVPLLFPPSSAPLSGGSASVVGSPAPVHVAETSALLPQASEQWDLIPGGRLSSRRGLHASRYSVLIACPVALEGTRQFLGLRAGARPPLPGLRSVYVKSGVLQCPVLLEALVGGLLDESPGYVLAENGAQLLGQSVQHTVHDVICVRLRHRMHGTQLSPLGEPGYREGDGARRELGAQQLRDLPRVQFRTGGCGPGRCDRGRSGGRGLVCGDWGLHLLRVVECSE